MTQSPWWSPDRHADRRPFLLARNRMRESLRGWFAGQGFVEVETGCLQVSPGNETHLHAFATEQIGTNLDRRPLFLHTSPEFAMKKLLAAGEERIFQFAPSFRNREQGPLHAPEFTMLEWYRGGFGGLHDAGAWDENDPRPSEEAAFDRIIDDAVTIVLEAAEAAGAGTLTHRGREARLNAITQMSVRDAFIEHLAIDLSVARTIFESRDRDLIADVARRRGHRVADDDTFSSLFSRLMAEIEPELGIGTPLVLTHYPVSEAALAVADPRNRAYALRFEIYACGVELANGFVELTDGAEQRRRLEEQMAERERIYGERYPIDEDFIAALAGLPEAVGCALGFDRLVMLTTGATHIDQVRWTPVVP